jgi:hypothetical protein
VWIDGELAGESPRAHRQLPAGRHHVRVELEDQVAETDLTVGADRGVRYTFASATWETVK